MMAIKENMKNGRTLDLPERHEKPRRSGLTAITDVGIAMGEMKNILEHYSDFIDLAKLGIGSAYIEPRLTEKIALFAECGIPVYFGGTLFEKYYHQQRLPDYFEFLHANRIDWIEISEGTIEIGMPEILSLIWKLKDDFTVLVEVGKKKESENFSDDEWIRRIQDALYAGCSYVVLEGRNTAEAGLYNSKGELNMALIQRVKSEVQLEKIIIEAATAKSQNQIINIFGTNVNLGNVFARDLLILESQRMGLREETFYL